MNRIDGSARYDIACLKRALAHGQTIQFDVPVDPDTRWSDGAVDGLVGTTTDMVWNPHAANGRGRTACRIVAAWLSPGHTFVRLTLEAVPPER